MMLTPVFSVTYLETKLSPQVWAYQLAPTNQVRSTGLVSSFHAGSSGLSVASLGGGDVLSVGCGDGLLLAELLLQAAVPSVRIKARTRVKPGLIRLRFIT
ncbi:hypothetical protein [Paenibacillus sp. PastF-3]|uniref:hypothetical protein n=1 Tax=Paenibacillus sp. PastF-3 TaxID=2940626 RepID=UPI002475C1F4|nr:hypothetical protein [Paenibacillus sp. PastF-3]